jgi:ABC-2 type transport system permease protein
MSRIVRPSLVIMGARRRMVANVAARLLRERRPLAVTIVVLVAAAMYASYTFAGVIFDIGQPSTAQVDRLVTGALTLLTGFTAVTSITFALSSLYFSRDLDTLLSLPLRPAVVLLTRMITQLCLGVALGVVIVAPPLLALTLAAGRPLALPLIGLAVIGMVMTPLALATALVVVAVRLIPARYVRDAGGIVVTVSVFLITCVNLFLRGGDVLSGTSSGHLDLAGYGSGAADAPWQPIGWSRRAVSAALAGDSRASLLWALPSVAVGIVLVTGISLAAQRVYVSGFLRNAAASSARPRRRTVSRRRSGTGSVVGNLVTKDLRELRRDPSQLGQLIVPIVLFAFYIGSPGRNPGELSAAALPAWFGSMLTASFAALFSASGLALRGIGSEGGRFWVLRTAPISARQLLGAKWLVGFVVAFVLGGLLLGFGSVRTGVGAASLLSAFAVFALLIAGLVGLAAGLGAVRPRLDWTDPRRAVGVGTTLLFLAMGSVYITICFVALALSTILAPGIAGTVVAAVTVGAVAAATAAGALAIGGRRLAVIEA